MTDDSNARYRSSDPFAHAPDQAGRQRSAGRTGPPDRAERPVRRPAREQQHAPSRRASRSVRRSAPHASDAPIARTDAALRRSVIRAEPAPHLSPSPRRIPTEPAPATSQIGTSSRRSIRSRRRLRARRYRTPPIAIADAATVQRTRAAEFSVPPLIRQQARLPDAHPLPMQRRPIAPFDAPSAQEPAGLPSPPFHPASGPCAMPPPHAR